MYFKYEIFLLPSMSTMGKRFVKLKKKSNKDVLEDFYLSTVYFGIFFDNIKAN